MKTIRITNPEPLAFEAEHVARVREVAPECMVLLKNNGTLPMAKGGKLALYGSGARKTIKGGTGSGDVNTRHYITVEEGFVNAGYEITTGAWLDAYDQAVEEAKNAFFKEIRRKADEAGANPLLFALGQACPEPNYELPLDGEGDTAVYVLARISGEGADRLPVAGDVNLTEAEIRDILALNKKYEKFVLVLNIGGMVDLTPVSEVGTILLMGQLGTPTGDALADVLTGAAYPSGKLAMTWAPINDYPSTEGFGDPNDTPYKEGIYVGYRYFDTVGYAPTYPFGYGIGYTTFAVAAKSAVVADGKVTVTAAVTNTGAAAGKEVVQVYYSAPAGAIDKPYQELAGYAKTAELAPGQTEEVSVTFPVTDMASYDEAKAAWVLEAGTYYVRVGNCSRNTVVAAAIVLDAEAIVEQDKNIVGKPDFEDPKYAGKDLYEGEAAEKAAAPVFEIKAADIETKTIVYAPIMEAIPAGEPVQWSQVVSGEKTMEEFVAGLSDVQMANLCIGDYIESDDFMEVIGNASHTVAGAAGETCSRLRELGVPTLVMADGPAGLRLSREYKILADGSAKGGSSLGGDMMRIYTEEERAAMAAAGSADDSQSYYQYCVAIPIGTALAQSWNDSVAEECGKLVGIEMGMFNCPIWLAPALNIQRSPLCGRDFEYYSEDPVISGRMAAAVTNGVQATPGCATTIKHYAFNNQETNRYFSSSNLSERAMREIYLKGFEICIKESQPHYIMTSYNLVNGVEHTCNNRDLNTCVLRDEWGYTGVVMTDWLVTGGMGPRAEKYACASAAGCVKSGNDITMPGMVPDREDILEALRNEEHPYHLTRGEIQVCCLRILNKILELDEAAK